MVRNSKRDPNTLNLSHLLVVPVQNYIGGLAEKRRRGDSFIIGETVCAKRNIRRMEVIIFFALNCTFVAVRPPIWSGNMEKYSKKAK